MIQKLNKNELNRVLEIPLFSSINIDLLNEVLSSDNVEIIEYKDKEIINSNNTLIKRIGIILKGKADVMTLSNPNTFLKSLDTYSIFGIANLFSNNDYVTLIKSHKISKVLFINKDAIQYLIKNDDNFLHALLRFYSEKIVYLNQKMNCLTAVSVDQKLAIALLNYNSDEIILNNSISIFSEMLNVGRASLYRAFNNLINLNLVSKDGKKIIILDRNNLIKYSNLNK